MNENVIAKERTLSPVIVLMQYGLLVFTLLVAALFGVLEPRFLNFSNFMDIISSTCVMGIVGIGATIIMSTGEIDFACGSELALGAVTLAVLLAKPNFDSYILAFCITILVMIIVGIINAFLHIKVGIPAFIATMGTSLVLDGINKRLTKSGRLFSPNWPSTFKFLGHYYVFGIIPVSVIILVIIAAIMWTFMERSSSGKRLYAVGANNIAARYVGIDSRKVKLGAFVISAVLCGFAGIMQSSMLNSASPYMGETALLNALTMLMLGGMFFRIGVFNIPGTLVGAFLVTMLNNGLTMMGIPTFVKYLIQGFIMLISVISITIIRRKMEKLMSR